MGFLTTFSHPHLPFSKDAKAFFQSGSRYSLIFHSQELFHLFSGTLCEHNIDDCLQVACQNGGTCLDGLNEYFCNCHPGFRGRHCGTNFDECSSSPCRNGGICLDGVAQYHCQCQAGFTGLFNVLLFFLTYLIVSF